MILTMMKSAGLHPNAVSYTSLITAAKVNNGTKKAKSAIFRVYTHRHDVRACRHYMPRFNTLF
jgi:hypothetical protein